MLFPADLALELVFHVLSYLPVESLEALRESNRHWSALFHEHGSYIYRNAAALHGFVSSNDIALETAIADHTVFLASVPESWRDFCRMRLGLERKWTGEGEITWALRSADRAHVHRIKVDEELGIIITTHEDGGLNVRDIDTDEVLWALPRTYIRNYAHCEYENGFLIFDRFGQSKEVWRLASQYDSSPVPPEEFQTEVAFTINQYFSPSKGIFKPWAVLTVPESGRAFRFVYPMLAVVGAQSAYLYDVTTCELTKTINDIQASVNGMNLGEINYVEIDSRHLYICGSVQLRIFDRKSGALVYSIPAGEKPLVSRGAVVHQSPDFPPDIGISAQPLTTHVALQSTIRFTTPPPAQFVGVHVNSDEKAVVCLLSDCRLLLIKDITELTKGSQKLEEHAMEIQLGCPNDERRVDYYPLAVYLACDRGRVGVVTSFGIYIITMDGTLHGLVEPGASKESIVFPYIKAARLVPFSDWRTLTQCTCLQMTARRMYFVWHRHFLPRPDSHRAVTPPLLSASGARLTFQSTGEPVTVGYNENGDPLIAPVGYTFVDADGNNGQVANYHINQTEDEDEDSEPEEEDSFLNKIVFCADFTLYESEL